MQIHPSTTIIFIGRVYDGEVIGEVFILWWCMVSVDWIRVLVVMGTFEFFLWNFCVTDSIIQNNQYISISSSIFNQIINYYISLLSPKNEDEIIIHYLHCCCFRLSCTDIPEVVILQLYFKWVLVGHVFIMICANWVLNPKRSLILYLYINISILFINIPLP